MKRRVTNSHLISIERKIRRFKGSEDDLVFPDGKDNELQIKQIFKKKSVIWIKILAVIISVIVSIFIFMKTTQG